MSKMDFETYVTSSQYYKRARTDDLLGYLSDQEYAKKAAVDIARQKHKLANKVAENTMYGLLQQGELTGDRLSHYVDLREAARDAWRAYEQAIEVHAEAVRGLKKRQKLAYEVELQQPKQETNQ
jgi:hypothetical protein